MRRIDRLLPLRLSPRRLEIAERVACGEPYKRIAFAMGISIDTVDFHVRAIAALLPRKHLAARQRIMTWVVLGDEDEARSA